MLFGNAGGRSECVRAAAGESAAHLDHAGDDGEWSRARNAHLRTRARRRAGLRTGSAARQGLGAPLIRPLLATRFARCARFVVFGAVMAVAACRTPASTENVSSVKSAPEVTTFRVEFASDGTANGATLRIDGREVGSIDEVEAELRRAYERARFDGRKFLLACAPTIDTPWNNVMKLANAAKRVGIQSDEFKIDFRQ